MSLVLRVHDTLHKSITAIKHISSLASRRKPVPPTPSSSAITTGTKYQESCQSGARPYFVDDEYGEETGTDVAFRETVEIRQPEVKEGTEVSAVKTRQNQGQRNVDNDQQSNLVEEQAEGSNDETRDEANFEFLGCGKSGVVYGIDSQRVLKVYHDEEAGELERRVYQRVTSHAKVAKLLEIRTDGSILLERGVSLRTICQASSFNSTPIQARVRWLRHAAEGYQCLHNSGIIHADVGCNNLILAQDDCVKLIDFEGCSMDGGAAGSCYEWFSYCPSTPRVTRGTDIFAFGCAVYEVSTGRPPYYQLEASDNKYREVEELYAKKSFPSVEELPLGQVVHKCWNGYLRTMEEVIQELDMHIKAYSDPVVTEH